MLEKLTKFKELLFAPKSPYLLGLFRIGLGIVFVWEAYYMISLDFVKNFLTGPAMLFNYKFLPVEPISEIGLQFILNGLVVCGVLIALGLFYRIAMAGYFVGFSYLFLLDKGYYNNHLYLFCLVAFLMIFIRADETLSLNRLFKKDKKVNPVPAWHYHILQFQIICVYFFGGIAKLNSDWLVHGEPARTILGFRDITSEVSVMFITYAGTAFDLLIGFLLLYRKTRLIAILGVIFFNCSNMYLFSDINIFPFMMLFVTILFLDADKVERFISKIIGKTTEIGALPKPAIPTKAIVGLLSVYVLIQLWLPLRHYFIPGHVDWTGEGQRFAWRMKIQHRETPEFKYGIFDLEKRTIYPVELDKYLNPDQINQMKHYPEMMHDFALFIGERSKKVHNITQVQIKLMAKVSLNGRPAGYVFPPNTDLTPLEWNTSGHNYWVVDVMERAEK